jgi:glycosyltransferase involved in cell wall biosynthesis
VNTIVSQALATGLPVVTTRHSGLPEQVTDGENGLLVDEADVDGLAAALTRLMEEPRLVAVLSARAREHVRQRYDAQALIERQVEVYVELTALARRSPPEASAAPPPPDAGDRAA